MSGFMDTNKRHEIVQKIISNDGQIFSAFVCDECARFQAMIPKTQPESGVNSWLCAQCNHFNIGSTYRCVKGQWLRLWITEDCVIQKEEPPK